MKATARILNKKGQALVEFAILLPIIFIIFFAIFDVSSVFYNKHHLEGVLNDVVVMVENGINKNEIERKIDDKTITYNITYDGNYATVTLKKRVNFTTPLAYSLFKNGFVIESKRTILYE